MRNILLFQFILALLFISPAPAQDIITQNAKGDSENFLPGVLIFKLKESFSDYKDDDNPALTEINKILETKTSHSITKLFPKHVSPKEKTHITGQKLVDLSLIYKLTIPTDEDIESIIQLLTMSGVVDYAEKYYIPELFQYIPDDPLIDNQYYLENIQAYDAWEISRSDTNQVIAIVDTGTDLYHPDLVNSIKYNYDDNINGEDSDSDGYIDNFYGWDLGEGDNDPQYNANSHGVLVSGLASATADNGTGIAGTGFNSKLLPVKIDNENGALTMAYEGIIYAADRGAKVINLSWGGNVGAGQFGQDIINYAVLNRDVVVIAAAGNSNNQNRIFPAAYQNSISIAATDNNDIKWSGSSFGITIDICAPGSNVFTTWPGASYNPGWGTSFAAPIASGAAAILRSHFPDYNALQIGAQMKVTADRIDTIAENQDYEGLLGTGRLNLYRALTETDNPYIKITGLEHEDDYYASIQPGESFQLAAYFQNILASAENIHAVLETNSQYIDIIESEVILGNAPFMEIIDNINQAFIVNINENYPPSQIADFIISFYVDGETYAGRETFSLILNKDYLDIYPNNLSTTITSHGSYGYNYPNFSQGIGFQYNSGRSLIMCAGLIIGNSTSEVVDNVYGAMESTFNQFFNPVLNAHYIENPDESDMEIRGKFNDDDAGAFQIEVEVDYNIKTWEQEPDNKYMIFEYKIINNGQESLSSIYAGIFADWFIQDYMNHRAAFDEENKMGYAYSAAGGDYTGISLLSESPVKHYAFDNKGFGGSLKISDGFTSFEKYTALKSNRNNAGIYDVDNDISTLVSTGPFVIEPGDTTVIAFALIAGDHLNDLIASAQAARVKYTGEDNNDDDDDDDDDDTHNIINSNDVAEHLSFSGENPFTNNFEFNVGIKYLSDLTITISNINGMPLEKIELKGKPAGKYNFTINSSQWPAGIYILQLNDNTVVKNYKVIKVN